MVCNLIMKVFLSFALMLSLVEANEDWWQTSLMYRVYLRSFKDSDGDGVGDLGGLSTKLDYLKELAVDAIILSPIYKSPLRDFGFDISDYYSVNPEYGTMDDMENLIKKASNLKFKIILDLVPNHTSNESEWFTKSLSKDEYYDHWYIWENGHIDETGQNQPPNNWISVFGKSAWTFAPTRNQFYLHQFGTAQPDLNMRNPVVVDEIKNIMKFWLEKGIAGFFISSFNHIFEVDKDLFGGAYPDEPIRSLAGVGPGHYDYLDHIYTKDHRDTYELLSQLRGVVDAISIRDNVTRLLITEARTGIKNTMRYYGDNQRRGAHVPVNFVLIEEFNKTGDARDLKYAIDHWLTYKPIKRQANWMTGNHDTSRVASRFGEDMVDAFNMMVLLLPGVGITYMGEELGMSDGQVSWTSTRDPLACGTDDPVNYMKVSRDPARTPFQWDNTAHAGFSSSAPWLPVADSYTSANVRQQGAAERSHLSVYKKLGLLRKRAAFRYGHFDSKVLHPHVFAFKRSHSDDGTYVVVVNLGRLPHAVSLDAFDLVFGALEVEVSSHASGRVYGDIVQANHLEVAPEEAIVLRMTV